MARRKGLGAADGQQPAPSGFLGALRSELDESADLHEGFQSLETAVASARAAYLGYRLTPEGAGRLFSQLKLRGTDRREWTLGSTSGDWYSREIGTREWVPSEAPFGVEPDEQFEPEWMREGISHYFSQNPDTPVSPETVVSTSATTVTPQAPAEESFRVASAAPLTRSSMGDDSASWLWDEWNQDTPQAAPLRVVEGAEVDMPESIPEAWNEDQSLAAALEEDPVAPAARDEGFTAPEDFFLRPDGS